MSEAPSAASSASPAASAPRIVDLVFAHDVPRPRVRALLAGGLTLVGYGAIMALLFGSRLSLETWSAELAARVHADLAREDAIEIAPPPPPPVEKPPPPPVVEDPPPPPAPSAANPPRSPSPRPTAPPPPAQAGQVIARAADPDEPADLTGNNFVTGTAKTYVGGATTTGGTGKKPVSPEDLAALSQKAAAKAAPRAPSRARSVALDEPDWRCPWPREAEGEEIDEQTAVVRVVVANDGRVESAAIVTDPGHGFGAAAAACARSARYTPALDDSGAPIRGTSPPIRVHFIR